MINPQSYILHIQNLQMYEYEYDPDNCLATCLEIFVRYCLSDVLKRLNRQRSVKGRGSVLLSFPLPTLLSVSMRPSTTLVEDAALRTGCFDGGSRSELELVVVLFPFIR